MSALKPQFPAKVCEAKCKTCIFGPNSPLKRARFAAMAAKWAKMKGGHQTCHQWGVTEGGEDVWCRGFWETQVDFEWRTLFEALGYVVFVPPEPEERAES